MGTTAQSPPSASVAATLAAADCVCFDVDSTVCTDEGIDELAAFCGAGEAVAAWTAKAMGGSVGFREALAARLDLIRPSRGDVTRYIAENAPSLSPGVAGLIAALQAKGADVYLVSGGFRQMIGPVADAVGVPRENIYANNILFADGEGGEYAGFDEDEFTSESGGKARAVQAIRARKGYSTVVMVGDGATDGEARELEGGADAFVCYGGVVLRESVAAGADWVVTDMETLQAGFVGN